MQLVAGQTALYLSQVLEKPVRDAQGGQIARLHDLIVRFGTDAHPPLSGIVARQAGRRFFLAANQVAELSPEGVRLRSFTVNLQPFVRRHNEALLRRDILDKQLIDVDGRRVVRASDLVLALVDQQYRLVGVDIGVRALLRRIGPARFANRITGQELIDWSEVESFATDVPMVRLRVPHEGVARLHPVDIARIVESLSFQQGQEVLATLDDETAAEAIQELSDDNAASHIVALDRERAADILDEMDPDEAADILNDLDEDQAADLLARMETAEAADVRELLDYEDDTAGGMMTTDFVTLTTAQTVGDALTYLRTQEDVPNPLYHLYLVPAAESWLLQGVLPLRALVLADPATPLGELMETAYHHVEPDDPPRKVALTMAQYNLPDIPVVDEAGEILGVIVIDDAIHALTPTDDGRGYLAGFSS